MARRFSAVDRILVCALAAWMSLCCCEKRILAHAFDAAEARTQGCCAGGCCADAAAAGLEKEQARDDRATPRPVSCCADGCCTKAAFATDCFTPAVDTIGAALPTSVVLPARLAEPGRILAHEDRAAGEPPPRLALVISGRLRI